MTFNSQEAFTWFDGPTAGTAFVNSIPSQRVIAELLYSVHRQLTTTFASTIAMIYKPLPSRCPTAT